MSPKAKEQRSAGELEEDSCIRRKRSRRVSFAETTVHVFKRDDESESPANSTPVPSEGCGVSDNEGTVGFRGIQSLGDDSVESAPEDEEERWTRLRFVRDAGLSSPGSAVGSVTSNEDDNFFGPVSTSFINSGRLSESGMSDDNNHDITLDSTAFSLHFRNIAPPDEHLADSAGSLRTPTGDTTPMLPLGFLVGREQTKELANKSSVGKMSNVSGDSDKIDRIVGGSHSYDYGKLSLTLEALMDEVNLRMQHNSSIGDCRFITSGCQTDEVGGIMQPGKDGEEVGNQNSCCAEPGFIIHCSVSPMGTPTINESFLRAKAKALTSHSNSEKLKRRLSPVSVDRFGKGHEAVHPEIMVANGQNSKLPSPTHGALQNNLNQQDCHIHQELFTSTASEGKSYPDSSLNSISAVLSISDDAEQKLESASIAQTPKNATKSFHSSALQEKTPSSHGQEQQQFLSQSVPASSKFLSISSREKPFFRMETPDNTVKAFKFSSLKGSMSSQNKQRQLQYHSAMPQSESLHNSVRELSASLKMELREHEERISAIKSSITRSRFKSRMQTDCEAAPSRKDLITDLQRSLNEINDDPYLKHAGICDVNMDANEVNAAKHLEASDIVKDLNCSKNGSYLIKLDTDVTFMETVEKGQSEKCIEFCCDSSLKLPHALGLCASSVGQRESDLIVSKQDIPNEYALANKDKSALSLKGCVTSAVDEITSSRDLLERKSLQPVTALVSPSIEKVSNGGKLKVSLISGTLVNHGKTAVDSKTVNMGGLYLNKKLNEDSASMPKKVIERPMLIPYKAPVEVLEVNTTLGKSLESSFAKIVQSPNNHSFNKMDMVSLKKSEGSLSYFHGPRHQNTESQQETYCDCDVSVVGDIGNKQTCHTENHCYSEIYRMHNSPVPVPEVIGDPVILSVDHSHHDQAFDIGDKAPQKRWTDVFSKLSDITNQLLPQSISELSLQKLDDIEDLLDELQTARKYEGLCITLRNQNCFSYPHQKRVIDAKSLIEKLGLAKARKQLKCFKLKKLRNKVEILQSQVDECDKLKSIYVQLRHLCSRVESDDMKLEEQNRLVALKQELGFVEQKIKLLLKSFEASCKLTGKMSCNDVIKAVDEHVMRRAFCKEIQEHVQLWKLCDVVMKNDHCEIILGYCNLLLQRFTINKNRFSSMVANILSNAANIIKRYPNMNACIAFEFVFKLNVDQKIANSNCIYEKTVETNLLMGTLIDVLEEILLSRLELLNLIFSTFLKQSSGELELQLCFYSSSSSRKLILGVDMTSLNCGVYPSDPSELKIQVCEQQTTLPSSIVNKAIDAVRSLECGHLMILRLCRCVSQVVQCSN